MSEPIERRTLKVGTQAPRIGVVADDITGANDIGSMFASRGCEAHVYAIGADGGWTFDPLATPAPDVCILDTNSRLDPGDIAYAKVHAATLALRQTGCKQFFNKTCSVFRGNIGAEFDAMLDALDEQFAAVVVGFPRNGRLTIHGQHYVNGVLLAESSFRDDPTHPMRQSDLLAILSSQTRRRVVSIDRAIVDGGVETLRQAVFAERERGGYAILDVPDQAALATIANVVCGLPVLCGSSALGEELPKVWGIASRTDADRPIPPAHNTGVLCVAGSLTPQTRAQIKYLRAAGVPALELPLAALAGGAVLQRLADQLAKEVAAGRDTVLHTPSLERQAGSLPLDATDLARAVADTVAEVTARVIERSGADRLVVAGGETSAAVCKRLGVRGMRVWREIQPGLPSCVTLEDPPRWLVLKSGSFGTPNFLAQAIAHLKGD